MNRNSFLLPLLAGVFALLVMTSCSTNPTAPQDITPAAQADMARPPAPTPKPPLQLITPNGGERVAIGETITIAWLLPATTNITPDWSVTLSLSTDGGKTFPFVIARKLPAMPSKFAWKVDGPATSLARIKVVLNGPSPTTNPLEDESDGDFLIGNTARFGDLGSLDQ
jgi:hypothetical protein